ncbi:DinB family protein [Stackebrandtia nassauensis]|uniref:Mini-circle protein n=1 Tax=Stackebrandtia nassauensis (strain DSM 44728 / CIP 108903 / NRRL B-16338 / NBRC 102104 / LLR-40K-21) TaxID=446470 RepID=D3PZZ9_STANL|nr:DUF664 domain-containing protein [Stackebrandtia nassauensis]ADD45528.1 protein of unknown function DUF664 [Stackebrandtia nassauensis DSM 44728]
MSDNDEQIPTEPPLAGEETAALIGSLERQRRLFAWKCGDLDAEGLRLRIGASSITLGGLLKHLALVEDDHFARLWQGRETGPPPPWDTVDWDAEPDWDWKSAVDDTPEQLRAGWRAAVARSRERIADGVVTGDMGRLGRFTTDDGGAPNLRRILIDMIEEYSRHNGHADLIREAVDGRVGEDPPRDFVM